MAGNSRLHGLHYGDMLSIHPYKQKLAFPIPLPGLAL